MNDPRHLAIPPAARPDGIPDQADTFSTLARLVEYWPGLVILVERSGKICANRTAIDRLGSRLDGSTIMPCQELIAYLGQRCCVTREPISAEDHPLVHALQGRTCQRDLVSCQADSREEIMLRCQAVPIWSSAQVTGAILSHTDFSDLHQSTNRLHRSNRDLEQFMGLLSHDLREPLRLIRSYLSLLRLRPTISEDGPARQYLDFAEQSTNRLHRLLENLLDLTRLSTQGIRPVWFASEEAVNEAIENLEGAIRDSEATILMGPMAPVLADRTLLVIVLRNLLSNAIKYRRSEVPPLIEVSSTQVSDHVLFKIRDNGVGIAAGDQDIIFAPFQRLPNRTEAPGSGLGLDICRRVLALHRGVIWVESSPDAGSTFCFTLPQPSDHRALEPKRQVF